MSLLKVKPFSLDQTETFLFANANIAGNLVSGNANLGNLATANNFSGDGSRLSNITAANITGQVSNALIASTVYTAAQPNITSLGTLANLTVSGVTNLGAVANVRISGGSNGFVLRTDGAGNLSWVSASSATGNANVAGSNTQIQYNDGNNLAASANLTFNVTTRTLTVDNIVANGSGLTSITGANVTGTVANATNANTAGTVTTAAQPNITSVGNLTALTVTGNLTGNNANFSGTVTFNGNMSVGAGAGGNISGANVITANLFNGTLATAAQPNITSVGTLTSLTSNGNITVNSGAFFIGNGSQLTGVVAASATRTANGNSNVDIPTANGNVLISVAGNANIVTVTGTGVNVSGTLNATGNATVGNLNTTGVTASTLTSNVATGTAPLTVTSTTRVANLNVDRANVADFISVTTQTSGNAFLLLGNAVTGNIAESANSVFVANSSNGAIHATTFVGALSGAITTAAQPNITSVGNLTALTVTGNLTGNNANFSGTVTFNGNMSVGSGTGGNISGANVITANTFVGTLSTAAQPNITSVGTLSNLTVSGALAAGDTTITGNLTVTGTTTSVNSTVTQIVDPIFEMGGGANGANLTTNDGKDRGLLLHTYRSNAVVDSFMGWMNSNAEFTLASNASVSNNNVTINQLGQLRAGNAIFGNTVTANFFVGNGSLLTGISATTSAGLANGTSNISVPTANGNILVSVGGNANVLVVTSTGSNINGTLNVTGNSNVGNLGTSGLIVATGNVTGGNLTTGGALSVTGNANVGNIGAASGVFTANVTATNFIGNLANGNSSISIPSADGNINISVAGTPNELVITSTGINVAGTLNATGNANVGNIGAAAGVFTTVAGNLTTAAQPNITSLGTLSNLTSNGTVNFTGASNVSLGAVANIKITGGSANYFLKTDGSGNLSWSSLPSTTLSVDTFLGDGTWTMKTLSIEPLNINYTIVAIGGIFQPRDAYSVTGAVITFDDPPPDGAVVEITTINGGTAGASGYVYQGVNSNTTAIAGVRYLVDTSSANVTMTLPSSAVLGDEIGITDATGNAASKNITVSPNGGKINGSTANLTLDINSASVLLTYYNSTRGWVLISKV